MSRVLGEAFVVLRADDTGFRADATAKIKAATQGLNPNVNLGVNLNTTQLAAKTAAVKAAMASLGGANLGINLNDNTLGSVAGLESRLTVLRNSLQNMPVTIDDATSIAKLASLQVQASKLDESLKNMNPGMDAGPAAAQLLGLEASMKRLTDDQGNLAASADGMTHVYGMWTTVISALRGHVALFGGALEGLVPEFLASVGGFHLLTEGIIEVSAVWAPAIIGLAAFGIAAEKTFQQIVVQMTNLNTVSNALGVQMPGLSGDFQKVQAAVKPEAIQLFGEALLLANKNGGTFGQMAVGVGHDLDQLAARFTLAMDNKAVGQFAQATTADFAGLGTAIGNFGGIIGNLMKAVPGYAHILLGFGTEALQVGENITAVGEPLVAMGLKAHGALIYAGLLGTLLAKLAGGSFSLAAKAAGGLSTKLLGIATAAESGGFTGLSSVAEKASYGMAGAENAASKLSNISWGWVGIGVAALILLDKWMGDITTQAQAFVQGWEAVIQNAPIGQVMTENAAALAAVDVQSQKATATLHQQSQAFTEVTKAQDKSSASIDKSGAGLAANRSGMTAYTATTRVATAAVETYNQGQQEFQAQGKLVSTRLQGLASDFGSTANAQGLLNAAGITTSQITDTNNQHWQQAVIQMEAQQAGFKEMELGAGRYGAAMNALNNPLVTLDSSMSKITQAQTTLMSTITGSESAFDTFQQGINTLGTDAKGAAPNLSGLGAAGLQMNSDFYTGINNAQSMISALEQQGITTKNLTKVVATQAGEMLHYAGSNAAARATVMSLINDAVGPGTVNFKNLDHWVGQNSTSLSNMNGIVGTTTVNAAGASGAIDTMSTQIFDQQLLLNSQASPALKTYADDIEKYGINASQTKSARQQLISDLEKTGDNANTAKGLVAGLTKGLNGLPTNVTTTITDKFTGLGKVAATQQILGESSSTSLGFMRFANAATGGLMKGGTPGKDSIPAMVMPGELIVPTHMVNAGAVDHLKGKLPGFASGGMVMGSGTVGAINSALSGSISGIQSTADTFAAQAGSAFSKAAAQAMAQEAAASSSGNIGGKLSGSLVNMLEQFASKVGWNASQVSAWEGVIQLESGGSFTAKNPGSDAYGLAQFINGPGEYAQYGGNLTPSGQVTAMGNYIHQRYGDPSNALAHEHCVTLDAMILTKRGWLAHDEVKVGDETLGYNFATGRNEWTPVTAVLYYEDAPLVRLSNKTWEAVCTPNHRWVSEHWTRTGSSGPYTREAGFTEAQDLTSRHRIRVAAPADTATGPDISLQEAELLGWVMGDGSVAHPRGTSVSVRLYQSKPQHVEEIDRLVTGLSYNRMIRNGVGIKGTDSLPLTTWEFSYTYSRDLIKRSGYEHTSPVDFVISLNAEQRTAFLKGVFGAEGSQFNGPASDNFGTGKKYRNSKNYSQSDGPQQDAIVLALYLEGHRPGLSEQKVSTAAAIQPTKPNYVIRDCKPYLGGESIKQEDAGRGAVWCVTTGLGSWTMRQGRQVMLTGNSYHWYKDGGMVPKRGSGKNFAGGGSINEPVVGMGMNSGQTYRFGEGGRQEIVSPVNGNSSNSDNSPTHSQINTLISQNQQLISIMQQQPNSTAAAIAKNRQVSRVPR